MGAEIRDCTCVPRRKCPCIHTVYCWKYAIFYVRFPTRCLPKPFASCAIESKVKKRALRSCACSNLQVLSLKVPEHRPLQACFNAEAPWHRHQFFTIRTHLYCMFGCDQIGTINITRTTVSACDQCHQALPI